MSNFPVGWAEWNGRYRDTVRRFWIDMDARPSEFGTRIAGSSVFTNRAAAARMQASISSAHDGFSLQDLVSYNEKHNGPMARTTRTGVAQSELELRRRRADP